MFGYAWKITTGHFCSRFGGDGSFQPRSYDANRAAKTATANANVPLTASAALTGAKNTANSTKTPAVAMCTASVANATGSLSPASVFQVWVLDYFGGVKTVTPEEYFQASPYTKCH